MLLSRKHESKIESLAFKTEWPSTRSPPAPEEGVAQNEERAQRRLKVERQEEQLAPGGGRRRSAGGARAVTPWVLKAIRFASR